METNEIANNCAVVNTISSIVHRIIGRHKNHNKAPYKLSANTHRHKIYNYGSIGQGVTLWHHQNHTHCRNTFKSRKYKAWVYNRYILSIILTCISFLNNDNLIYKHIFSNNNKYTILIRPEYNVVYLCPSKQWQIDSTLVMLRDFKQLIPSITEYEHSCHKVDTSATTLRPNTTSQP